ncbi:TMEM43 family protein [Gimesia sp.]|uniref:TMEM43 family protein n=1 Tax=Gimesia sp. TaxID=2024833 RepID=UPI003A8EBE00
MNHKAEDHIEPSFGKRFQTAVKNLGIGIIFLMAGLFLLWHNESEILEREIKNSYAKSILSENQEESSEQQNQATKEVRDLQSTTLFNWGLRFAGWIIVFLGLATLFKPLVVLVDKIPFLWNFVGRGITVFALLSSFSLTLILLSAVWMVTRPVFGAVLLLSGVVPLLILYRSGRRARLKHALKRA